MTCNLNIRGEGEEEEALFLYKNMASGNSSYVHLVAGGYVSLKQDYFPS